MAGTTGSGNTPITQPAGRARSCSRRGRGATRAATTSRPSSAIPACRTRRCPSAVSRQRDRRQPRNQRRRRALEHRGAGRRRDQRPPGREPARRGRPVHARSNANPPIVRHRHRPAAGTRPPVRLPHHGDERARPARPVRVPRDPDRQAARRLEGRRVPLLPAARPRVGDAAHLPRDRRAAGPQLRDRPADEGPGRQPRHLHPAVVEPRRRALLDVRLRRSSGAT